MKYKSFLEKLQKEDQISLRTSRKKVIEALSIVETELRKGIKKGDPEEVDMDKVSESNDVVQEYMLLFNEKIDELLGEFQEGLAGGERSDFLRAAVHLKDMLEKGFVELRV